jgi:C-terminal processing protease CtpA/Prc
MEEMRKQLQQMRGLQRGAFPGGRAGGNFPFGRFGDLDREGRMGASIQQPSDTLADQLNLPDRQGMVLKEIQPDSAAARAGLKDHDILLELNGKPVPRDMDEFQKLVRDIKPDAEVDAVVLRKGRKETIKGLKLPEAKQDPRGNPFRQVEAGKAKVSGIEIIERNEVKSYGSADEVPETHRAQVKELIQMSEGGRGIRFNFRNLP